MDVRAAAQHLLGQVLGQQVEVGALVGDHAALPGAVDQHQDHAGVVRVGAADVGRDPLALQVGHHQVAEVVGANLADEAGRHAGARDPHGHVRGRAARRERDSPGSVAAWQQQAIRLHQHIPD